MSDNITSLTQEEIDNKQDFDLLSLKNDIAGLIEKGINNEQNNEGKVIAQLLKELIDRLNPEISGENVSQSEINLDRLSKVSSVTVNESLILSNGLTIDSIMMRHGYGGIYQDFATDLLKLKISNQRKGRIELLEATKNLKESSQNEEQFGLFKRLLNRGNSLPSMM